MFNDDYSADVGHSKNMRQFPTASYVAFYFNKIIGFYDI
jgi:hypothetical protein